MATDKDKLMKGIRWMAVGFPFIFMGPALFTWQGVPHMQQGNYIWAIVSVVMMIVAAYFCVKGLMVILSSFFDS